jgi:CTP synthase
MNCRFIFVVGGVISGLGKGITCASLALLLEEAGYSTTVIKADPYLNLDAGTMNPIVHGETFVTEDGLETDQDIGHYERFLNRNLQKANYMTAGQVFLSVIQNERRLEYNGECVEFVRHVPEEINKRLFYLAKKTKAEIIIVEIGGTVGDIQNILFLESIRQLKLRLRDKVLLIHVAYLPLPKTLGELKSKPVQQSVSFLLASGVQPDLIVTRAEKPIDKLRKEKIATFCNVYQEDIIDNPDLENVYQVPDYLSKQQLIKLVKQKLALKPKKKNLSLKKTWQGLVKKTKSQNPGPKIAIVGKYFQSGTYALEDAYVCVIEALRQAYYYHNFAPNYTWLSAQEIEEKGTGLLKGFAGIIVPQGWGSRGVEGKILAAKFARENKIPYLGLCFGMQMAVIEFARNVLKLKGANSTEVNPKTNFPVIDLMASQQENLKEQRYGGTIRLGAWPAKIRAKTKLEQAYRQFPNSHFALPIVQERHRHRYEFNNQYLAEFEKKGMITSANSPDGKLVEAVELQNHPFYLGVQFHPEYKSRPLAPHPIFLAFINVASKQTKVV